MDLPQLEEAHRRGADREAWNWRRETIFQNRKNKHPNSVDETHREAISATVQGDEGCLRCLLQAGLDVERVFTANDGGEFNRISVASGYPQDPQSWNDPADIITLLHLAARRGQVSIAKLLLRHGAVLESAGYSQNSQHQPPFTPLSCAVSAGELECVQVLLEAGARTDYDLFTYFRRGHGDRRTKGFAEDLMERSLNCQGFVKSALANRRRIFELLLTHGANIIWASPHKNFNLINNALRYHSDDFVRELIARGARCHQSLGIFVQQLRQDRHLLGELVENEREDGWKSALQPTKDGGPDRRARYQSLGLVLECYPDFVHDELEPWHGLVLAARYNDIPLMEQLVSRGVDINSTGFVSTTNPIYEAVETKKMEAFQWLMRHGANPNPPLHDPHPYDPPPSTPLQKAIQNGPLAMVQQLLEGGANADMTNRHGETAIHLLCTTAGNATQHHVPYHESKPYVAALKMLLQYGADPTLARDDGQNALHLLVSSRYGGEAVEAADLARMFLAHGTDPHALDYLKRSPSQIALERIQDGPTNRSALKRVLEEATSDYQVAMASIESDGAKTQWRSLEEDY